MNLTRDQAIAEHRKMWNWIADEIEEAKTICDIHDLKYEYLKNLNLNMFYVHASYAHILI